MSALGFGVEKLRHRQPHSIPPERLAPTDGAGEGWWGGARVGRGAGGEAERGDLHGGEAQAAWVEVPLPCGNSVGQMRSVVAVI